MLLRCRVEKDLLAKANKVTDRLGSSTPEIIRIFLAEIARTGKVPVNLNTDADDNIAGPWAQRAATLRASMTQPKPGEVYWVDLGMAGKVRPLMVVSREDENAPRALAVCVPLTTEIRGGDYEVSIPRVRWMPAPTRACRMSRESPASNTGLHSSRR